MHAAEQEVHVLDTKLLEVLLEVIIQLMAESSWNLDVMGKPRPVFANDLLDVCLLTVVVCGVYSHITSTYPTWKASLK